MNSIIKYTICACVMMCVMSCGGNSTEASADAQEVAESKNQPSSSPKNNQTKIPPTNTAANPGLPDTYPMYPGCTSLPQNERKTCSQSKIIETLQKVIKYPSKAKESNVHGTVVHSFIIEADGTMTNLQLEKSLTPECDAAAYHAIVAMMDASGPWTPGTLKGKNMAVKYSLPIQFGK